MNRIARTVKEMPTIFWSRKNIHPKEGTPVSVRRDITQTMTVGWGCDICGNHAGIQVTYNTRTVVERDDQGEFLVNTWTDTDWDVCLNCSTHVDNSERAALMERAAEQGEHHPMEAADVVDGILTPLSRTKVQGCLHNA